MIQGQYNLRMAKQRIRVPAYDRTLIPLNDIIVKRRLGSRNNIDPLGTEYLAIRTSDGLRRVCPNRYAFFANNGLPLLNKYKTAVT